MPEQNKQQQTFGREPYYFLRFINRDFISTIETNETDVYLEKTAGIKSFHMTKINLIGFVGVAILLVAYFLNLINKVKNTDYTYLTMNFIGAGLSCLASVLLKYLPFIILEASWTLVSVVGLFTSFKKKQKLSGGKN